MSSIKYRSELQFHAFIYYSTSLQIFLFYKFFCTNISTIFRRSHHKCSIKSYCQTFVIFTGKHLWWGLFFNKVEGHQTCRFITKGLQHRYFVVNFEKFVKAPILKNISERLHFWKGFCENIFADQNLAITFDYLLHKSMTCSN